MCLARQPDVRCKGWCENSPGHGRSCPGLRRCCAFPVPSLVTKPMFEVPLASARRPRCVRTCGGGFHAPGSRRHASAEHHFFRRNSVHLRLRTSGPPPTTFDRPSASGGTMSGLPSRPNVLEPCSIYEFRSKRRCSRNDRGRCHGCLRNR